MCGTEYCQTCNPDPNGPISRWVRGETHLKPEFGDGAQAWVAREQRRGTYLRTKRENLNKVLEFPEFWEGREPGSNGQSLAKELRLHFDTLVAKIPEFAQFVAYFPPNSEADRRKRRKAAGQRKRRMIACYVAQYGMSARLQLLEACGRTIPPQIRLHLEATTTHELPLAA